MNDLSLSVETRLGGKRLSRAKITGRLLQLVGLVLVVAYEVIEPNIPIETSEVAGALTYLAGLIIYLAALFALLVGQAIHSLRSAFQDGRVR